MSRSGAAQNVSESCHWHFGKLHFKGTDSRMMGNRSKLSAPLAKVTQPCFNTLASSRSVVPIPQISAEKVNDKSSPFIQQDVPFSKTWNPPKSCRLRSHPAALTRECVYIDVRRGPCPRSAFPGRSEMPQIVVSALLPQLNVAVLSSPCTLDTPTRCL